jgi:hypothetical protein
MADQSQAKKGNKGLIIGLSVFFVLLASAGTVFCLAIIGKINIPGITPKVKSKPTLAKKFNKKRVLPKITPPKRNAPIIPPSTEDPEQGAEKLALVWNEMPTDKLKLVVEKWNPAQGARVLNKMDSERAAALLALLKPATASTLSQQMQILASKKNPTE